MQNYKSTATVADTIDPKTTSKSIEWRTNRLPLLAILLDSSEVPPKNTLTSASVTVAITFVREPGVLIKHYWLSQPISTAIWHKATLHVSVQFKTFKFNKVSQLVQFSLSAGNAKSNNVTKNWKSKLTDGYFLVLTEPKKLLQFRWA